MELYSRVNRHDDDQMSLSLHIPRVRKEEWIYTEYVFISITGPMTHEKNIGIRDIVLRENFKKGDKKDVVTAMFDVML